MSRILTPFQLWCLFCMFRTPDASFGSRALLLDCCDSAIKTLSDGDVDTQLSELHSMGYIEPEGMLPSSFTISNSGILYIRKNLANVHDACMRGLLPDRLVDEQDDNVAESLRNKDPSLKEVLIQAGIRNMGSIPKLERREDPAHG